MIIQLLKRIGYHTADDALDFIMCGLAVLPGLMMLGGFFISGAIAMCILLLLAAMVGMLIPPPAVPSDRKPDAKDKPPLP